MFYVSHEDVFHLKNTKSFAPDMHRHAARARQNRNREAARLAATQTWASPGNNHAPAASTYTPVPEPIRTGRHQDVFQADSKCASGLGDLHFDPQTFLFCPKTFLFCSPPKCANPGSAGWSQGAHFCRHCMIKNVLLAKYAKNYGFLRFSPNKWTQTKCKGVSKKM